MRKTNDPRTDSARRCQDCGVEWDGNGPKPTACHPELVDVARAWAIWAADGIVDIAVSNARRVSESNSHDTSTNNQEKTK